VIGAASGILLALAVFPAPSSTPATAPAGPTPAVAPASPEPTTRLTLAEAEQIARQNNPAISVARLSALASQQVSREARAAYYPTLDAYLTGVAAHEGGRISAGSITNPAIYSRAAGGVAVNQLITDFGRTSNLVASSTLHAEADDARSMATTADILLAVDRSFYAALGTQALLRVAEQTVAARQNVADQVRALAQSKLRSELDASFAAVDLAEANLLLVDAQNNQKAALAALSAILGYPNQRDFTLVEDTAPLQAPSPDIELLITEALSRRPEVAALDLDTRSLERFHFAEQDLMRPNIRALGTAGGSPWRNDAITPWYGAIGVNVAIPIFNGFLFQARATEAGLRAEAAKQRLTDLRNAVARDVRTAWLDAGAAYDRVGVAGQLLVQANRALDLARSRYDLGLSSIVELSQAQLQQTRAELGEADARYRYKIAAAALQYQLGGK
jgi:outer membrane protein